MITTIALTVLVLIVRAIALYFYRIRATDLAEIELLDLFDKGNFNADPYFVMLSPTYMAQFLDIRKWKFAHFYPDL